MEVGLRRVGHGTLLLDGLADGSERLRRRRVGLLLGAVLLGHRALLLGGGGRRRVADLCWQQREASPLVSTSGAGRVQLTFLRYDPQGDAQAGVLDQLDDVGVRHANDGLAVHRQDAVSHLQPPAAVGRAALDDAADFMRHGCGGRQHAAGEGCCV